MGGGGGESLLGTVIPQQDDNIEAPLVLRTPGVSQGAQWSALSWRRRRRRRTNQGEEVEEEEDEHELFLRLLLDSLNNARVVKVRV